MRYWPYAVITAVFAFFYWPLLAGSGVIWNDFIEQYFPYRVFAATALRGGQFPFWNPYVFGGMPFLADLQTAVLYPPNTLLTLFSSREWLSPLLVEYQILAHVLLAGLSMYLLARTFTCGRVAATVAGVTYMLCGFTTTHIFHVTMIHALAWFPLLVLTVRRALRRESLLYAGVSAVLLGLVGLAGHPQLMIYVYYWLGAYLPFECFLRFRRDRQWQTLLRPVALFVLMVALGAGITSVQLIPAGELGAASERPEMAYEQSAEGSFRPYRFVTLLVPNYFGTPNNYYRTESAPYWGMSSSDASAGAHYYWETALYVGLVALLLAVLGAVMVHSPLAMFLAAMALLSVLLAMGDSFIAYWLAYRLLPGFSTFRLPGRFACMFALSMAPLAGIGTQWVIDAAPRVSGRARKALSITVIGFAAFMLLWGVLAAAGAFKDGVLELMVDSGRYGANSAGIANAVDQSVYPALVGQVWWAVLFAAVACAAVAATWLARLPGRVAGTVVLATVIIELCVLGRGYAAVKMKPSQLFRPGQLVRELQKLGRSELFRINMRDSRPGTKDTGGRNMVFHKNEGSVHRLFLMEGYNPLRLKRKFLNRRSRTLDIMNARFTVNVDPSTGRIDPRFPLKEHPTYFPRARMVYRCDVTSPDSAYDLLYSPAFDHVRSVVLEEPPSIELPVSDSGAASSVRITDYGLNRIEMKVTTDRNGLLVLSEVHYPAWSAAVDGQPAPLYRADYALRAIPVTAGTHTVVCSYRSAGFRLGLMVTLLAVITVAAVIAIGVRTGVGRVTDVNDTAPANNPTPQT